MKKGIAVPYIIAILLGIAVIGLIGYWFFVSSGKIPKSDCELAQRNWCTRWFSSVSCIKNDNEKAIDDSKPSGYPIACSVPDGGDCKAFGLSIATCPATAT